jgi:uncharacterized lipoprotein YmbA
MKTQSCWITSMLIAAAAVGLCGCLNLKPVRVSATRYFVLSPIPATNAAPVATPAMPPPAIGVGAVKLPSYLLKNAFVVRQGSNEVKYLETAAWAESLDRSLQLTLASDLATRVPTDQLRLSAWRSDEVTCEIYVTVQQFDVDATGRGVLTAWWRILSPGGEKILKAGQFHASRPGPDPRVDPQSAAATLSQLTADFSAELARTIKTF